MKVAHESPLSIIKQVQQLTDYDYCLVHLCEEIPEYTEFFKEARDQGREVILDNSIFELEEAFDADKFAYWTKELRPTWYIVPDALEDCDRTIQQYADFVKRYPELPGKSIGVVQGETLEEIAKCYSFMSDNADMIAISFDYSFFEHIFPNEPTKFHKWMKGRQWLLDELELMKVINYNKPHHLLGCGLPQEFKHYVNKPYVYSCDTSNPVVHGIHNQRYTDEGLEDKLSIKLFTLMNMKLDEKQVSDVVYNIEKFKELLNV